VRVCLCVWIWFCDIWPKAFPLFGVPLMLITINIQYWDGEWYNIFVFPHSFEVSVSSFSQVNTFCLKIVSINKDRVSEWIRTSNTLVCSLWHLVRYVAQTIQHFQFLFTIHKFPKYSQCLFHHLHNNIIPKL
jgi:hypothetical protein